MNKKIILSILIIVGIFKIDALTAAITIEEITVTARYRSENLQQVPLSISAFSSDQLDKAAIRNVDDLANFTSNMTFSSSESSRLHVPVIRGMGMIDTRGFDNNVSIFVDGAFISGRSAQNVGMLDFRAC